LRFLSTVEAMLSSPRKVNLLGVPLDCTTSFRPGTRFGPHSVRLHSDALESYSPALELDMDDFSIGDLGDLALPPGGLRRSLEMIEEAVAAVYADSSRRLLILGGEHLLTLPVISSLVKVWPELRVIQLDAHLDLRDQYEGEKLSHATVMNHVLRLLEPGALFQVGVRSGTREEFRLARSLSPGAPFAVGQMSEVVERVRGYPCYLTLDLDVVDPGFLPGTGAPEPGGITSGELLEAIGRLRGLFIVGCDVVELSPPYDPSGASALLAAKVTRELLLLMASQENGGNGGRGE